jgi:hypothetical protein
MFLIRTSLTNNVYLYYYVVLSSARLDALFLRRGKEVKGHKPAIGRVLTMMINLKIIEVDMN